MDEETEYHILGANAALRAENATLRATIAEKDKEIERLKEELQDQTDKANSCLATMDAAIDEYGKAEAELANLQERMKGVEEAYKWYNEKVSRNIGAQHYIAGCKSKLIRSIRATVEGK